MKKNILVGAYHLQKNARDEEHIKDIKDCGIDFIIGMEKDTAALDLFEKFGLGAIVSGAVPGWWGGFGENCGKLRDTNSLSRYEEYAARFVDHPAAKMITSKYLWQMKTILGEHLWKATILYWNILPL